MWLWGKFCYLIKKEGKASTVLVFFICITYIFIHYIKIGPEDLKDKNLMKFTIGELPRNGSFLLTLIEILSVARTMSNQCVRRIWKIALFGQR